MKKVQKTYGVYNLMEWQCNVGGKTINFTGGAFTGYGIRPAQYTTRELFLQTLIENSRFFKSGRIKLLKTFATDEEIKVQSPPVKKVSEPAPKPEVPSTLSEEVPLTKEQGTATTLTGNGLHVTDRDDAVCKLNKDYGIALSRLTTRAAILEAAKAVGVTLVGWPKR